MVSKLKVRNGSRVSLRTSGCCASQSHSGFGVVYNSDKWGTFRVAQGGNEKRPLSGNCHHIGCLEKVIKY